MTQADQTDRAFETALLALARLAAARLLATPGDATSPLACIECLVIPVLERIGREWEQGRLALSQVYMSGRICEELIDGLLPTGGGARGETITRKLIMTKATPIQWLGILTSGLRAGLKSQPWPSSSSSCSSSSSIFRRIRGRGRRRARGRFSTA